MATEEMQMEITGEERRVALSPPAPTDASAIWSLVRATPALDENSPYAYLLLCSHFAATGLVARIGRELAGFVLGYTRPDEPATAFVWQVAVAGPLRGRGLAGRLVDDWFRRCTRHSRVRFLEATVTPSNDASRALFAGFARRHHAPLEERVSFAGHCFPDAAPHEDEISVRVGPIARAGVTEPAPQEILL